MIRLTGLLLLLFCLGARGSQLREETWFAVFLQQQHVGFLHSERIQQGDRVDTRMRLQLELRRNGERMRVHSEETAQETAGGAPLAFSSAFDAGQTSSRVSGEIDRNGMIHAIVEQGGSRQAMQLPWPEHALLSEGQRLALLALPDQPGARQKISAFDPTSMKVHNLLSETIGYEPLNAKDASAQLALRIRQNLGASGGAVRSDLWLDPVQRTPLQMRVPAMGLMLEMRACSAACAQAPVEGADVLVDTLLTSPRPLGLSERRGALRFNFALSTGSPNALIRVPGQYLDRRGSNDWHLVVDPEGSAISPPLAADLAATRWLQSDDPALQALARDSIGRSRSPQRKMQRLEQRVRGFIRTKSMRIGYASAAEVMQLREGDCTEHAVLLAALGRAAGIPTRIVTGLAYTPRFGEREDVFVPHAWVVAWIDGNWRGFDAALPRFDSGHIGLTMGSGDPFDFYAGLDLLGRLKLQSVESASRTELSALLTQAREQRL